MRKSIFLLMIFLIAGCATLSANKISLLKMGMSKDEVQKIVGKPYLLRAQARSQDNKLIETWEYTLYAPSYPTANGLTGNVTYWLQFEDGKLVFYGQPGDYGTLMPDRSQEEIYHHIIKEDKK